MSDEFKLDPAHKFVMEQVNRVVILRDGKTPVEKRMDAASMMGMYSAWCEAQEALIAGATEIRNLRERIRELENRIKDASILMVDWDGYYNPETKQGNAVELAKLIEDAFRNLQNGKSWRDKPQVGENL